MVAKEDASALNCSKLAVRGNVSPVRGGGSPVRGGRSTSSAPGHTTGPGSLLRSEFNLSFNNRSDDRASECSTAMLQSLSSVPEEQGWMDRVIGIFQAPNRVHDSDRAPLHACYGAPFVGPASISLPSITFKCPTMCDKQEQETMTEGARERPSSARGPSSPQSRHDSEGMVEACIYPKPPSDSRSDGPSFAGLGRDVEAPKVVLDERSCRAGCGSTDFISTAPVPDCAKNKAFRLDPRMIPEGGDWRGNLSARRGSIVYQIASRVVASAYRMSIRESARKADILDRDWQRNGEALQELLTDALEGVDDGKPTVHRHAKALTALSDHCKEAVKRQDIVVKVGAPVKVFGDVHGQLRDLLLLFARFGFPTHKGGDIETTAYVFNGDFIDRGAHQLEVVLILISLKCLYPNRVFLLRGNHEFAETSEGMGDEGFRSHVARQLVNPQASSSVYSAISEMFNYLPLAALICGKALVLHGGVGDGSWRLEDLLAVRRPLRSASSSLVRQIVW